MGSGQTAPDSSGRYPLSYLKHHNQCYRWLIGKSCNVLGSLGKPTSRDWGHELQCTV